MMSKEEHLATRTTGLQGSELASGEFCLLRESDPDYLPVSHTLNFLLHVNHIAVALWNVLSGYWHLLCIYSLPPHSLSSPSESS
jgi:hypothetical protein